MSKEKPNNANQLSRTEKALLLGAGSIAALGAGAGIDARFDHDRIVNPITPTAEQREAIDLVDYAEEAKKASKADAQATPVTVDHGDGNFTYFNSPEGTDYTVQAGDNPTSIAARLGQTPEERQHIVREVQQEDGADNMIHPGDQMHLGDKPVPAHNNPGE